MKKNHLPKALKIKDIIQESPILRTYVFEHSFKSRPGQFVMLWIPGVDEKPMSIGYDNGKITKVGIAKVGKWTNHLFENYTIGDRVGVRGPYGTAFDLKNHKRIALVGGGFGTPPMVFLAYEAMKKGIEVDFIEGARTAELLLYIEEMKHLGVNVHISTDDGSAGFKGFAPQLLEQLMQKKPYDGIYTCGPEVMMFKVAQLAEDYNVDCEVSLERFMKCSFGVCGACCLDESGLRVCIDGPVMAGKDALANQEFGKYTRDSSGQKVAH